ncbi:MAG: serine--tRNA ligase [Nanoarchaeota archaeon]|nr:serine--tRNA ligase [Nanoarchaeota archaeon]
MIDIKLIRENPDLVKENMKKKFLDVKVVDKFLKKDEELRKKIYEVEQLKCKRNEISNEIRTLKKEGKSVEVKIKEGKKIPEQIKKIDDEVSWLRGELNVILSKIPNLMAKDVPIGKDDSENKVLRKWGKIEKKDFEVKNHVELLEELELVDFDTSAKVSGNGFYYLKGDLALLNQALISYSIDFMNSKGYCYIEPPLMLHKEVLDAAMDTTGFKETIYGVADEDLHLIGTSEHALLGLHANEAIIEKEMPKKYFSYSMCFRKEIGSHGINEKGLWRTHQFNKVEQFIFCKPEDSGKYYDEMMKNTEEFFQSLNIPYRVVECCSGDLALWKAKSADLEIYRPTIKGYGEVTSLTNCTDFQARGVNTKVVYGNGERKFAHTLNNTVVATSRAIVAIIENYQRKDGKIDIPMVLRKYMNNKKVIGSGE